MGVLYRVSGRRERAGEIVKEALKIGGKNDDVNIEMTKLGLLERERGDIPKPIDLFIDTIKIQSTYK